MILESWPEPRIIYGAESEPILRQHLVPGVQVDVIRPDDRHIYPAVIYQVKVDERLYLGAPSWVEEGMNLEVSFVVPKMDLTGLGASRFGFRGEVMELVADFEVSQGQRMEVAVLLYPSALKATTVRYCYRAVVPPDYGLAAQLEGLEAQVRLIDLSLAGGRLAGKGQARLKPGDEVGLRLSSGRGGLQEVFLRTRVVHWTDRAGPEADWAVGLAFLPLPADTLTWLEKEMGLLIQHQSRTEGRDG